jgi:AcrR family transcriptional regulator
LSNRSIRQGVIAVTETSKRDRIFAATVALLAERGLHATQTRDVTDKAGVGTGLLNHYFRWPDLRAAAWTATFAAVAKDMRHASETPAAALDRFFAESFASGARPYWRLWIEAESLAVQDSAMFSALASVRMLLRDQLTGILADGVMHGSWSLASPRATALRLEALRNGLTGLLLVSDAELDPEDAEAHLRYVFRQQTRAAAETAPNSPDHT